MSIMQRYREARFYKRNRKLIDCELSGKHAPRLIACGMSKMCYECGRFNYK